MPPAIPPPSLLFRARRPGAWLRRRRDLARGREIVLRWGWNATSYQLLNPGIRRWFGPGDSLVGYVDGGGYRVVAGAPVGPPAELPAIVAAFEAASHRAGRPTLYFAVEARLAAVLEARGVRGRLLLGAQPVWRPAAWAGIVAAKPSLRAQLARARNKGVTVERWPPARAAGDRGLGRCLDEWLADKALPPLRFLVEPRLLERLDDRRIYVARQGGAEIGYLVASPIPLRRGFLVEQIIRGRGAANGTAELLLDAAMGELAGDGAIFVTLGLSPLSRRAAIPPPPTPLRLRLALAAVRSLGRPLYDFEGLDAFKAKLLPEAWEPVWAMPGRGRPGLRHLWAIAAAFAGGSPTRLAAAAPVRLLVRRRGA